MSVVPGSIQARVTFISVSEVLSGTGTRNVLPDPRSTSSNTHWPLTECPLWYFGRPNVVHVDLNGLVRTADFLRAALQVYKQCLSAEHTPVRDRVISEVMFVLDLVGRFAAQDVVRMVQNLLVGEETLLEP